MENTGTFQKSLVFMGQLLGTQIINGASFEVVQDDGFVNDFLAYTGNRVNIYVADLIGLHTISRATPGLSIGINVTWSFRGHLPNEHNQIASYRELDTQGSSPYIFTPLSVNWSEAKIEYACSAPGSGLQLGEMDRNIYTLPINNGNTSQCLVIPVVARGDFMKVSFWCDPPDWTGLNAPFLQPPTNNDRIYVYAMSGSDAGGSQRIGGGQG